MCIRDSNWAVDVFDGLHVKERGDSTALIWANLDTGEDKKFSYKEFAEEGNKLLNFLRGNGVKKGESLYMMIPVLPEIWFAHYTTVKGGYVGVPTATTMTARDLEYRFTQQEPHAIVADEASTDVIDKALEKVGYTPKVKIVIGEKSGWISYDEVRKEKGEAEGEQTKSDDIVFAFFTSGTTGPPKRVAHTAVSLSLIHI